jgi:hypothetical protein
LQFFLADFAANLSPLLPRLLRPFPIGLADFTFGFLAAQTKVFKLFDDLCVASARAGVSASDHEQHGENDREHSRKASHGTGTVPDAV